MDRFFDAVNKPGTDALQMICDGLNAWPTDPTNLELRRLIAAWHESGPNLKVMLGADPALSQNLISDFRALYWPTKSGRAHIVFSPHGDPQDLNSDARARFMMITLSPDWNKFGGPCRRCDKYFIRKTAKQSVYCSHRCASQDTAIKRTAEVRREQRLHKLNAAKEAIIEWEKLCKRGRVKKGWKEWVAAYNPHAEITTRFLTHAVNQSALQAPSTDETRTKAKTK
jgi:hypothetical protein